MTHVTFTLPRAVAVLALVCLPAGAQAAGTFTVDVQNPLASDLNPGTDSLPFRTIAGATAAHNGPGTTILVKPGVYRESITVPSSGTAADPFVFRATASGVVLDGTDDFSNTQKWDQIINDVHLAATVTWNVLQVFVDGERLAPSTVDPTLLPTGSFRYVPGTGLYVNAGGGNPGARTTLVGRRGTAFALTAQSYVTIDGFAVSRYEDRAINLQNGSNNGVLRNNTVTFAYRYGIAVNGCAGVLVERNTVGDTQDHGIAITNFSSGCTVQDNECYRAVYPFERAANGIYLNRSTGNLLQRNRTHDNQDTGLHIGSFSHNNLSIQNISWNNGDHGFDHLDSQNTMDLGNVAYGNFKDGISIEGNSSGGRVANCIAVENGLRTNEFNLWVDSQSSVGFTSDYNVFWNSTSQAPVKFIATIYSTVAGYSAATGQDAHSIQADPRFVAPASANFHLQTGSPAIDGADSGVPNWPLMDAEGNGRVDDPGIPNTGAGPVPFADRGALESQGSTDGPPVVTAPDSLVGGENTPFTAIVIVSDPNGDPISSFTASGLPPGAAFSKNGANTSGTLTWTPTYTQAGVYTVTFTATNSLTGTAATVITVNNVNGPPAIAAPTTFPATENAPMTLVVSVSDPDGEAIASLTASNVPAGASFTAGAASTSGTLVWTPTFSQAGSYPVTFTASNALVGTMTTTIQVANVDRPPVVTAPAHAGTLIPNVLTFTITASDIDGEPITQLRASGMPPRGRFDADPGNTGGTFSWEPRKNDVGTFTVTFTATNDLQGTARTTITCSNVDGPPVVTAPASVTVRALRTLSVDVDAYDPEGQAITSLTALDLPSGASFSAAPDNESGVLTWTPGVDDQGTHTVTFRAANAFVATTSTQITVDPPDQAPQVVAPPTLTGNEAEPISFTVSASDPEGDPIASLTASGLPAGAAFVATPDGQSGTMSWTPGYTQAGAYDVTFTAANEALGSAITSITILDVDAAPVVSAPATASGKANTTITVVVTVADPDGDPVASLLATPPPGASFTPGPGNRSGTLSWTPVPSNVGAHVVTFTAQNAQSGTASTTITVLSANAAPSAVLTATPATGNAPLQVVADASGSSDPDGSVVSYRFLFGDGTTVGPGPSPTAAHAYAAGSWTLTVIMTDDNGATATSAVPVLVAATPTQPNLVGNPSFETGTIGWGGYSGGTLLGVAGGFDGAWGVEVAGDSTTVSFGCNDAPNWVSSVPAAGTVYRFTAWVRSAAHAGTAKIQVREYSGAIRVGWLYSNGVPLTPSWQPLTVDYVAAAAGSTIDLQVVDFPLVPRETFVTDNIAIRDITGTTTAVEPGPLASVMPLKAVLSPSPLRSRSTLSFATSRPGSLRVALYDVLGRRVRELAREGYAPAGIHRFEVEGGAGRGERLAAGVYFYRIEAVEGAASGRFVVLH